MANYHPVKALREKKKEKREGKGRQGKRVRRWGGRREEKNFRKKKRKKKKPSAGNQTNLQPARLVGSLFGICWGPSCVPWRGDLLIIICLFYYPAKLGPVLNKICKGFLNYHLGQGRSPFLLYMLLICEMQIPFILQLGFINFFEFKISRTMSSVSF